MAACSASTAAAVLPRTLGVSSARDPSRLSSSMLPAPLHGRRGLGFRGTATTSRRHIIPKVVAKKQTFSSFDDLLKNSEKPVLVDFYATWCGPCQFMVPVLDQVSSELKDELLIVKIDTEKYPEIAGRYDIAALPTFIIFKDGEIMDRFEGALPANQLIERLVSVLPISTADS